MSHLVSAATVLDLLRIVVPSAVESVRGPIPTVVANRRILGFCQRLVERAEIRLEVVGRERLPAQRTFVMMGNHQSHIDIPVVFAALPDRTVRMVGKTELFAIPLFGRAIRSAGFVEVDRADRTQAVRSLQRAAAALANGVDLWIAPEGTRSTSGALGPLKRGGFHLAIDSQTPIVPMAIDGTRHVLPPKARSMRRGVSVRLVIGAPIQVQGRSIDQLSAQVAGFLAENVSEP